MKKYKKIISLIMAAMFLPVFAVNTINAGTLKQKEVINVVNTNGAPETLHPALVTGTNESWIVDNMFKGLYSVSPQGVPELAIAESVNMSSDGLVWTFILKDFWWSSGNKGTANDFVTSYLYTLNPSNESMYMSNLWIIKNAEGFSLGEKTGDDVGVKAIDEKTLEITLEKPVQYLPYLLTTYTFYPIDSINALFHKQWYKSPEHFSSNGAFTLTKWTKDEIVISKNDSYYDKKLTNLDEIHFLNLISDNMDAIQKYYASGDLSLIYGLNSDEVNSAGLTKEDGVEYVNSFATYFTTFNTNKKPFNNPKIRKALSLSIDREYLIKEVLQNNANSAYTITPNGVVYKTENGKGDRSYEDYVQKYGPSFEENIAMARMLLKEGLVEESMTMNDFSFSYLYNEGGTNEKVANALQDMWLKNLGVLCTLESVGFETLQTRRDHGIFDIARSGWVGDYVDPMTFLELFTTESEYNYGNYSNDLYDQYIDWANSNVTNLRTGQLLNAEHLLIGDMAVMPVYFYTKPVVVRSELLDVYTPVGKEPNFEFAKIKKENE